MRTVIGPALYDFRRLFLRPVTVILLVFFTVSGIGLTLLAYQAFSAQSQLNAVVVASLCNGTGVFRGVVVDSLGRGVGKAKIVFALRDGGVVGSLEVSGPIFTVRNNTLFSALEKVMDSNASMLYARVEANEFSTDLPLTSSFVAESCRVAEFSNGFTSLEWSPEANATSMAFPVEGRLPLVSMVRAGFKLVLLDKRLGDAIVVLYAYNLSDGSPVKARFEYNVSETSMGGGGPISIVVTVSPENLTFQPLGVVEGFAYKPVRVDPHADTFTVRVRLGNTTMAGSINYAFLVPARSAFVNALLDIGVSLFLELFPVLYLYLAYVFMAKPRSSGVLEFILARPVTRWDVYVTRYAAGALTVAVTSAVFIASIGIAAYMLAGGVKPSALTTLYIGVAGSLLAFYTLFYAIAASLRPGSYLAASIALYLLYTMFWGLVLVAFSFATGKGFAGIDEAGYILGYLSPRGLATYTIYYIKLDYGIVAESEAVIAPLVALSGAAWVVLLYTLGYLVFRRANLSPS